MSGGVDSSVAAALLKYGDARLPAGRQGFDVVGIHLKMWAPRENQEAGSMDQGLESVCRQQYQDRIDAVAVAAKLDIPFQTWDLSEEYRRVVVEYMIRGYAAGRTPNPDVMCNREIKFGLFLKRALETGADYIATGHYARKREVKNKKSKSKSYALAQARDTNKDQAYFLWTLTQEQLRHCLFPIGEYQKSEVREMARKFGLPTAEKPDSQGVCFIGEFNMREFLKNYIPERPGRVETAAGAVVGEHSGVEFYTIGQRHGIGLGGGIPYYVANKDLAANTITVAEGPYDGNLFRKELIATDTSWVSGQAPHFPLRCQARIRYRQPLQRCTVQADENDQSDKIDLTFLPSEAIHRAQRSTNLIIRFTEPQRAVTPGQSIVFYRGEPFDPAQGKEMLGGGIIA